MKPLTIGALKELIKDMPNDLECWLDLDYTIDDALLDLVIVEDDSGPYCILTANENYRAELETN